MPGQKAVDEWKMDEVEDGVGAMENGEKDESKDMTDKLSATLHEPLREGRSHDRVFARYHCNDTACGDRAAEP